MVMAPLIAVLLESVGLRWLFVILAVITATPLIWTRQVPRTDRLRPHRTRHRPTRAARAILLALGAITLGGSSVFVYSAAIGEDLDGLSPLTVSLLFSGNALGCDSFGALDRPPRAGGRLVPRHRLCALAIAASRSGVVFGVAIVGWGFVFFMGVPAAFNLLAERSSFPEERAGDAQAMMALGPGLRADHGWHACWPPDRRSTLGFAAAAVMSVGAFLLLYVDRQRFVVVRQYGAWSQARASVDSTQHA